MRRIEVTPSAKRLVTSLRSIGHSPPTAIADLIDNSVSAGASVVQVRIDQTDAGWRILIADDGTGIRDRDLDEAMRFGTRRGYGASDLGRFGLGLKTASTSLGRKVTVVTRTAPSHRRLRSRVLDLDHIDSTDRWEILDGRGSRAERIAGDHYLDRAPGTVVVIEALDRVFTGIEGPDGPGGKHRMTSIRKKVSFHLRMVFHRLLEDGRLVIGVNGRALDPWDPFALTMAAVVRRPEKRIRVFSGDDHQDVMFRPYILPARHELEATGELSAEEVFKDLGGPSHWNRQQGFYIYRGDRMIQSGGWCGLRAIDEHTKLARVALDFSPDLDALFSVDIAKMRATLPSEVRSALEIPVHELCRGADEKYRAGAPGDVADLVPGLRTPDLDRVARMLHMAAFRSKNKVAYDEILAVVAETDPDLAGQLGWKDTDGSIRQVS